MAKPRIFISSTFYDLQYVRADLDRFIKDLGYDTVLNELGNVAYGKDEKLEEYCYKEMNGIDIMVAIIGGRFGSESNNKNYSITQMEIKKALELDKQVYIFIEKNVHAEYQTYLLNKESTETKYKHIDDVKIYEFIEHIESLPSNNNVHEFQTSHEIVSYLREQWAGLFQRFLQEQTRIKEINLIIGIENTAKTLNQLVNYLTEERKDSNQAIKEILVSNHPAMEEIQKLLGIRHRVFFTNITELDYLLRAYRFIKTKGDLIEEDLKYLKWLRTVDNKIHTLEVNNKIFNEDTSLKVYTKSDWDEKYITLEIQNVVEEDLPF